MFFTLTYLRGLCRQAFTDLTLRFTSHVEALKAEQRAKIAHDYLNRYTLAKKAVARPTIKPSDIVEFITVIAIIITIGVVSSR
ncbi:MAG TPA: hypothetical protein VFT87_01240 [Candidatus Saccharimonadales bacterium]|nr:hypothetical protein [Candidatus Saccharimonadales bacterium]